MKSGDELLEKLRLEARRNEDVTLLYYALDYEPCDWYWLEYWKTHRN